MGDTSEWSEALCVVEFVIDNTPAAHGYTPRDLDRGWSLGLPLERELLRDVLQYEEVSEYARRVFGEYTRIRNAVVSHWNHASEARAKLANKCRRTLRLEVGDQVMYRDPRSRSGGRTPWKKELTGPWQVVSTEGNRLVLRLVAPLPSSSSPSSTPREVTAHAEDVILLPKSEDFDINPEGPPEPVKFEDSVADGPRSVTDLRSKPQSEFTITRRGRPYVLRLGDVMAYHSTAGDGKICKVGRVVAVAAGEGTVTVHRYGARTGGLRVRWAPVYLNREGVESFEPSERPSLDVVTIKRLITKLEVNADGVLDAAGARRLDKGGYRLSESMLVSQSCDEVAVSAPCADSLLSTVETERWGLLAKMGLSPDDGEKGLQRWFSTGERVDFIEVFAVVARLSAAARAVNLVAAPSIDRKRISYGQRWDLSDRRCQAWLAFLFKCLRPRASHFGTPHTNHKRLGREGPSLEDLSMAELTFKAMIHQELAGGKVSLENSVGSPLFKLGTFTEQFGKLEDLRPGWGVVRTDGCQFNKAWPSKDGQDEPVERGQLWVSNFSLELMNRRCKGADAVAQWHHEHRPVKGSCEVKDEDGRTRRVSAGIWSGEYTAEMAEAYARCLKRAFQKSPARPDSVPDSDLMRLATSARPAQSDRVGTAHSEQVSLEELDKTLEDLNDVLVEEDITEAEKEAIDEELRQSELKRQSYWDKLAKAKDWGQVCPDLSVFGFGSKVAECHSHLSSADIEVCREVISRKASAFWVDGSARTTVRGVAHDVVPTGPPVSSQPMHLKGESAEWVDKKLEEEVHRGQLVRGTSPWGSAPFPTKEAPEHKRSRKRRLVVDYRRVNSRVKRSVYYCRRSSDVISAAAGSAFYTFVDAAAGFNQLVNTRRARQVLAIVSRAGKFLPTCLTFGPVSGPDDFCYTVDRLYSAGTADGKQRYGTEWLAYVDDLTVRTGRVIDGRALTDEEYQEEIRSAAKSANSAAGIQHPAEALGELGFNPEGLGEECDPRKSRRKDSSKHDQAKTDLNHPTRAEEAVCRPVVSQDSDALAASKKVEGLRLRLSCLRSVGFGLKLVVLSLFLPQEFPVVSACFAEPEEVVGFGLFAKPQPFAVLGSSP